MVIEVLIGTVFVVSVPMFILIRFFDGEELEEQHELIWSDAEDA